MVDVVEENMTKSTTQTCCRPTVANGSTTPHSFWIFQVQEKERNFGCSTAHSGVRKSAFKSDFVFFYALANNIVLIIELSRLNHSCTEILQAISDDLDTHIFCCPYQ
jgi:hypothetical protein